MQMMTMQLTPMQTTSNADNDADVDADNANTLQTMEDNADDRRQHK
jgi:hypothetical protein